MTVKLTGGSPGRTYATRGNAYTADSAGVVTVAAANAWDINDLVNDGLILSQVGAINNFSATVDPIVTNDNTQDYGIGSIWVNTSNNRVYVCSNAATGAAAWSLSNQPFAQFRNLIDGGDFTVNPFQRNIAGLAAGGVISTAITSTPTYFADRFFAVGGASSAILMAVVSNASVAGFSQALQLQRQSGNANTALISLGQVIESADSIRCQGQQVTLSFWAAVGANYSGGALSVQVSSGTGSNQSAASLVAGTWTGQSNFISATQALTTTMTRYSFTGTVPTGCTQLGILVSYTPSGTAGAADWIQFMGFQLEIGGCASAFEHRDVQVELEICQRYAWVTPEPAAGVIVGVGGAVAAANAQLFYMATPVQLYKAPTVTVSAGSFKVAASAAAAAATGMAAGTTHTPNAISITSTLTQAVGGAASLQGGGGNGYIIASADF